MNNGASSVSKQLRDEHILVVKRTLLFEQGTFDGLKSVDCGAYATLIDTHKEFLPRREMEIDPRYKQIIPYLVFTHNDRYFLMQRTAQASESRLKNKFFLGIGGHIRQEDMEHCDISAWAMREFHEEVHYQGALQIEPIGLVNDDSTEVGMVHTGFVFLLRGDSGDISVKSELASGRMLSLDECQSYKNDMELWSQLVHDYLSIK